MIPGQQSRFDAIQVVVGADSTQLRQGLKEAAQATRKFKVDTDQALGGVGAGADKMSTTVTQATKKVSDSFRTTGDSTKRFGEQTRRAMREAEEATTSLNARGGQSLTSFGGLLHRFMGPAALAGIAMQIGKVGFGFHDFTQKNELAFETMLGSAGRAKEFLSDILAFAKETPFSFPELTASAQRMVAFGVESDKVVDIMRTLGDATVGAGKGMADLDGVASVIGQISAKGRLQSEEILQLAERGIPALAVLANKSGQTVVDFQKQVTAGAVDADTAIQNLVEGLRDGTDGAAGTTAAYGGLMNKIKESGGLTSTLDSTKSSFRNMSAAITESLIPSVVEFLNLAQELMGWVKNAANLFNLLPGPVKNAAVAVLALAAANKFLNLEVGTKSLAAWRGFTRNVDLARVAMRTSGVEAQHAAAKVGLIGRAATSAKTSLVSIGKAGLLAFGGPAGLAVAGATLGISAYSEQVAKTKSQVEELKGTLDEATASVTAQTKEAIAAQLATKEGFWHSRSGKSALDEAEMLGVSLELVTEAASGSTDALKQYSDARDQMAAANKRAFNAGELSGPEYENRRDALNHLTDAVEHHTGNLDEAIRVTEQTKNATGAAKDATEDLGGAYRNAALDISAFTEEQQKAIDKTEESARKAFSSAFNTSNLNLNISSADDLAKARDDVTDATRRVRDAEHSLSETRGKKDVKLNDIRRAEEAVQDARKRAGEAAKSLTDVEARRDPVAQYKKQLNSTLESAKEFRNNIIKLGKRGLNAADLIQLQEMGPEKAKDQIEALLTDKSLIKKTNKGREQLDDINRDLANFMGLAQASMERAGEDLSGDLMLAFKISNEEGAHDTVSGLAKALGKDPDRIREVGAQFGLSFLEGMSDYIERGAQEHLRLPMTAWDMAGLGSPYGKGPRRPGYFSGGIIPGYTPGRDTMSINVGGGEAIMRPEWTRAVSPSYVHKMNSIARSGGVEAVRNAMRGFGGSFYNGGIAGASPQIVEVPVTSRVEHHGVTTIGAVYTADAADFGRQMRARRRRGFTGGRP